MSYRRIIFTEVALTGRAGFGMPTFDHPVGGTCVAVGHPGVGTGTEPRGAGGGALSSVKGRDCGVGSSGRRREYAR